MLEDHMPKPLQITLDTLLMENDLSSWQIRGGEHFIQVSIRFSVTAVGTKVRDMKYRRAPPSQIHRDSIRASMHTQYATEDIREHEVTNMIAETTGSQYLTQPETAKCVNITDKGGSTVLPLAASNEHSNPVSSHVQPLELHTEEVDTENIDTDYNNIDSDNSLRDSVKSEESDDYEEKCLKTILAYMEKKDQHSEMEDQRPHCVNDNPITEINDSTKILTDPIREHDDESITDGTYTCDGCGGMIDASPNSMWYRCTYCGDTDVCYECFNKDIHKQHKTHLQKFIAPTNWNTPYCDACGFTFSDPTGKLFICSMCEDYCICHKCKNKLLHINHSKHMKEECVETYSKDIG